MPTLYIEVPKGYTPKGSSDKKLCNPCTSVPHYKSFVEEVKSLLGFKAKGRDVNKGGGGYHLRENASTYMALSRAEKDDIGTENTYFWEINNE